MMRVPVQAIPSQTLVVSLARQSAQIALRQNGGLLYFSLTMNGATSIVRTRVCRDRQRLLLDAKYRGFAGDFAFVDTQGKADPQYSGLGSRWQLYYIEADE